MVDQVAVLFCRNDFILENFAGRDRFPCLEMQKCPNLWKSWPVFSWTLMTPPLPASNNVWGVTASRIGGAATATACNAAVAAGHATATATA